MLLSLGIILLCQLFGEATARALDLPIPGPVLGLVACVLLLALRDRTLRRMPVELRDGTFEKTGAALLANLSLLFIPAGVGVIQRLDVLAGNAVPIVAAVTVSTVLGLGVTAIVFGFVAHRLP
jgi:putative effector of murein hydrolase LrgA (UPF0299 family)